MYPKDTEKWKQFTTEYFQEQNCVLLLCIPKILKNESNSQLRYKGAFTSSCCCVSQRYWKMKAIHNNLRQLLSYHFVVVYPKDTEKWKQFTTHYRKCYRQARLLCIPKILKNESNSQHQKVWYFPAVSCCVSQRYWKMKAIHNRLQIRCRYRSVVVYPKDTEKWKQFTTRFSMITR